MINGATSLFLISGICLMMVASGVEARGYGVAIHYIGHSLNIN